MEELLPGLALAALPKRARALPERVVAALAGAGKCARLAALAACAHAEGNITAPAPAAGGGDDELAGRLRGIERWYRSVREPRTDETRSALLRAVERRYGCAAADGPR